MASIHSVLFKFINTSLKVFSTDFKEFFRSELLIFDLIAEKTSDLVLLRRRLTKSTSIRISILSISISSNIGSLGGINGLSTGTISGGFIESVLDSDPKGFNGGCVI